MEDPVLGEVHHARIFGLGRKRGDNRFEDVGGIAQQVERVAEVLQSRLDHRRRIEHRVSELRVHR
jgi:ATP-dependent 26S proteasome regulatory subunit